MKKYILLTIIGLCFSCNSEDSWDCVQKSGDTVEEFYALDNFNKIKVNRNIELILKQGENQEVKIETGENLLNDVEAKVIDGQLILSDYNDCNFVRDFGVTKAYVTSPNIEEIICSTQFPISSEGILEYEKLSLISENFEKPEVYNVGDFNLKVNCNSLNVVSNGVSQFNIEGFTNELYIGFFAGVGRFNGKDLIANRVQVFHDGHNDMVVNPINEIFGQMRGTGNVICHNIPLINTVDELYIGRVIFVE